MPSYSNLGGSVPEEDQICRPKSKCIGSLLPGKLLWKKAVNIADFARAHACFTVDYTPFRATQDQLPASFHAGGCGAEIGTGIQVPNGSQYEILG